MEQMPKLEIRHRANNLFDVVLEGEIIYSGLIFDCYIYIRSVREGMITLTGPTGNIGPR